MESLLGDNVFIGREHFSAPLRDISILLVEYVT